jgi:hypothetical protein
MFVARSVYGDGPDDDDDDDDDVYLKNISTRDVTYLILHRNANQSKA